MSDGILSQEEIDALLNDNDLEEVDSSQAIESIDVMEKDTLGEIANISMGTAATTLSSLLGKKVEITTPQVEITSKEKFREKYPRPYVVIDVQYVTGLKGSNLLIITPKDAAIIADLMMGGTGENIAGELSEIQLSAVSEAMNQMMGSASTSMSEVLTKTINISPPILNIIDLKEEDVGFEDVSSSDTIIKISFDLKIQGLIESKLIQLLPLNFAKKISYELLKNLQETSSMDNIQGKDEKIEEPVPEEYPRFNSNVSVTNEKVKKVSQNENQNTVTVKPVEFTQLNPNAQSSKLPQQNLDLILDVPLEVSVELGRTNKSIEEILNFSTGSIIELNKLAGEPVDLLVNGKLFAKGEVVVIDENFGVRITDIISPLERVKNLQ